MKAIGGYFELEINQDYRFPHSSGCLLNSGRHSLEYILKSLPEKPKTIWLPYYTCDVVLEPLDRLNIPYRFYNINEKLEISELFNVNSNEYIIANNYFGIKDEYLKQLSTIYHRQLIIDCAQAFFMEEIPGIYQFYSPRKFLGIPDGGIAMANDKLLKELPLDTSFERCSHLLKRIDLGPSGGYKDFKDNSSTLKKEPIKKMSNLTGALLSSINYEKVQQRRIANYMLLDDALKNSNLLNLPPIDTFICPMVYPYRTKNTALRKRLIDNQIFVATYWPNVKQWCSEAQLEYKLNDEIIPLPIDQRYGKKEMEYILEIINC